MAKNFQIVNSLGVVGDKTYSNTTWTSPDLDWFYIGFSIKLPNEWNIHTLWRSIPRTDGVDEPNGDTANFGAEWWHPSFSSGDVRRFVFPGSKKNIDDRIPPKPIGKNWGTVADFEQFVKHVSSWDNPFTWMNRVPSDEMDEWRRN